MKQISVLDLIGNTPLVKIQRLSQDLKPQIYAKLEFLNPSGSVKDRMAKYIIEMAEKDGYLGEGSVIVENSSGNTGAALAMIGCLKGYPCIITMPDKMSLEKKSLMEAFGARVVVTPTDVPPDSQESYYSVARRIASETPHSFFPDQYNNPNNIEAHYKSTGPEIWAQTEGKIDVLIAGIGTGGTLSGAGRFLKERKPNIKIIAVDPIGSVFFEYFKTKQLIQPSVYKVEGIGEDHVVKAVDFSVIDDILQVNDKDSFLMTRRLTSEEGLFAGGSSGAAMHVAIEYAKKQHAASNIVVILPDCGNRYLSKCFNNNWMKQNGFLP